MGTERPTPFDSDLAIVGSGGAAFSAAISARRANLRVVLIERGTIGGQQLSLDAAHALMLR